MSSNPTPSTVKWVDLWNACIEIPLQNEISEKKVADHQALPFERGGDWFLMRNFFLERLRAPEFHWFFAQGIECMSYELYVPAVSSLLNGIEASLRVTISHIQNLENNFLELSPYKVLSNNLISEAKNLGLPVEALAFADETDFLDKLKSTKPNRKDVDVVRHRNNICHGNILAFVNKELGNGNFILTPDSLKNLCFDLLNICGLWTEKLGEFRRTKKLIKH